MWVQVPLPAQLDMKKVDKLVFTSFLRSFFASFFVSFFVVILGILYDKISVILSKNLETKIYLQILFDIIIFLTPYMCIVSSILGTILFISKLDDHLELTAMKSLGISLRRIYGSLCLCVLFVGAFISVFSHYLSPKYKKKCFDIFRNLEEMDPSVGIKEGVFNNDIPEIGIYVDKKEKDKLSNVIVYSHKGNGDIESLFIADEGQMKSDHSTRVTTVSLNNGFNYFEGGIFDKLVLNNEKNKESGLVTFRNNFELQNIYINMKNLFGSSSFFFFFIDTISYEILNKTKGYKDEVSSKINELMSNIDNDYKNVFENISEKNEILLKGKIYDGIVSNNFNNSIVSWADDFKNKYKNIFSDIDDLNYSIRKNNLELLRRLMEFISCFFLIIIGGFFGFFMKRGRLILPLFIAGFFITIYFLGESLLNNFYSSNYYLMFIKNLGGSIFLFPFFLISILRCFFNINVNIFSFIRKRKIKKIINGDK